MKDILLALTLIIAISYNFSYAQEHQFGVQSGFGISGIHDKDKIFHYSQREPKPGFGYSFNLFYTYKFNQKIGFTIEPGYLSHAYGAKYFAQNSANNSTRSSYKKNYISMPITFNWYFTDKFYLTVGPEIQYVVSVMTKINGERQTFENLNERLRLNGIIGINYQLLTNLDIGLRYANEIPYRSDYSFYFLNYYVHFVAKYRLPVFKSKEK